MFAEVDRTKRLSNGYWNDIENRKRFFVQVAEELGFDPCNPQGWEQVTLTQIRAQKVMCDYSFMFST